ncbi:DUF2306 domain-containing protein [Marinihelvus fidelis]|uniref:DUF2306 domain-containing protein n=1 Tax=Marinihelvus fidelis TaxID=2613842 RepID=A0A5N0TL93_9GAMM|nr:DUF2306 domain-containing protein [Marinihelvus fidelis]KAA9134089.1 DUF2306 domain-containing protein [Marinihelvus fidelis]
MSGSRVYQAATWSLGATVWSSALLFGIYILVFFFVALLQGNGGQWNESLPNLYDPATPRSTAGIGLHFAGGGIILVLGCIQLLPSIRRRWPAVHRWLGRVYVTAAALTAVGGLVFIAGKGTIGGVVMDIAFAGYGVLMGLAAVEAFRHARARRFDQHRAWAIRLFALAIGSWLYRMEYGFWFLLTDGIGHTKDFQGWFDYFMDFFFYVPNLLVAELVIRRKRLARAGVWQWAGAAALFAATGFLLLATYYFTRYQWWPAIAG